MASVIAVANQKGGCGKTTLTMNLAGVLARDGLQVLVIDADPQASAQQWAMKAGERGIGFEVMTHPHEDIHRKVREMAAKGYDAILIDCPPGASQAVTGKDSHTSISRMALLAADLVIVPVRPSMLDYLASHQLLPLLRDVGSLKEYATRQPSPIYPPVAKTTRTTGVVRVELTVDENGEVSEVQKTSGPGMLQAAAKDAIKKWRFKPFTRDGRPVKASGFVSFNFAL